MARASNHIPRCVPPPLESIGIWIFLLSGCVRVSVALGAGSIRYSLDDAIKLVWIDGGAADGPLSRAEVVST